MNPLTRIGAAAGAFLIVLAAGYAVDTAGAADSETALGPGLVTVEIDIEHSVFSIDELHVRAGTTVRFVVRNSDPINHEFVTGDASVHARHEQGSESRHPPVPGEVSVDPGETGVTFYEFAEPGTYEFACHLPGHVAYGMIGEVVVTP